LLDEPPGQRSDVELDWVIRVILARNGKHGRAAHGKQQRCEPRRPHRLMSKVEEEKKVEGKKHMEHAPV
jgi:hypothetical protein